MAVSFNDLRDPRNLGVDGTLATLNANFSKTASKAAEIFDPAQTPETLTKWVVARSDPNPLLGVDRDIALDRARDMAASMPVSESASICEHLIDAIGRGYVTPRDSQLFFMIIGDIVESRGSEVVGPRPTDTLAKVVGDKFARTTGAVASMFKASTVVTSSAIPADPECFGLGIRALTALANQGQEPAVAATIRRHAPMLAKFASAEESLDPANRFRGPAANLLEAAGEGARLEAIKLAALDAEISSSNLRPNLDKIGQFIDKYGASLDLMTGPTGSPETYGGLLARALHIDTTATRGAAMSPHAQKLADYLGANVISLDAAARDGLLRSHMRLAANGGSVDFLVDNIAELHNVLDFSALTPREQISELEAASAVIEMSLARDVRVKGRNSHMLDDARIQITDNLLALCSDPIEGAVAARHLCALAHSGNNEIARRAFYNELKNGSPQQAILLADALDDAVKGGAVSRDMLDQKALKAAEGAFGKLKRFGDYRWFNKSKDPDTKEANRIIRSLRQGEPEPSTTTTPTTPTPSGRRSFGEWLASQAKAAIRFSGAFLAFGLKATAVVAIGTLAMGIGPGIIASAVTAGYLTLGSASAVTAATTIASICTGLLGVGGTLLALKKLKRH